MKITAELNQKLQIIETQLKVEEEKRKLGQVSIGRGGQIEFMLKQIATMRAQIEAHALPPVGQREQGMAMIVVDSWPMDSLLGAEIVNAEQTYLKLPDGG